MACGHMWYSKTWLFLVAIATAQSSEESCPSGWTENVYSGTCIKLYDYSQKTSWQEARAVCKENESDLVKIVNCEVNQFILDQISSYPSLGYWIGLHDIKDENIFKWLDEEDEAPFQNWAPNQPNHISIVDTEGQDCVEFDGEGGQWGDASCSVKKRFICEKTLRAPNKVSCPSGWTESGYSGTCIKLSDESKTWEQARAVCKEDESDLVKIDDSCMNKYIWDQMSSQSVRGDYWIGLHDLKGENKFKWLDEVYEAPYQNWAPNQPNDVSIVSSEGQDCAEIEAKGGQWNDASCPLKKRFICQKIVKASSKDSGSESPGGSGLSAGAVAGIVIGTLLVSVVLVAAVVLGRRVYLEHQANGTKNLNSIAGFSNVLFNSDKN